MFRASGIWFYARQAAHLTLVRILNRPAHQVANRAAAALVVLILAVLANLVNWFHLANFAGGAAIFQRQLALQFFFFIFRKQE